MEEGYSELFRRLQEKQGRLEMAVLAIAVSRAAALLGEQPAWQLLQSQLKNLEEKHLTRLGSEALDLYRLGRVQGSLSAIKLMRIEPKEPEDLAKLEAEITVLTDEITQLRNLLSD